MNRVLHRLLLVLDLFLAVTAIAGGIGLLTGLIAPGTDLLDGSIFSSYVIPGLALLFLAGGSATLATIQVAARGDYQYEASILAGAVIIVFELVEWAIIGYSFLQAVYLAIGAVIIALAGGLLYRAVSQAVAQTRPAHWQAHRHG